MYREKLPLQDGRKEHTGRVSSKRMDEDGCRLDHLLPAAGEAFGVHCPLRAAHPGTLMLSPASVGRDTVVRAVPDTGLDEELRAQLCARPGLCMELKSPWGPQCAHAQEGMLDGAGVGAQPEVATGQRRCASYPCKPVPGPATAGISATTCIHTACSCGAVGLKIAPSGESCYGLLFWGSPGSHKSC